MFSTLGQSFKCTGVGLHSGESVMVLVKPTSAAVGRYFVRLDLAGQPQIPATISAVGQTQLSTELRQGTATVRTVEHLLAALSASGVDNARIEIDGPEVPLLDGSAKDWVEAIATAGIVSLPADSDPNLIPDLGRGPQSMVLKEPIWIHQGDAFVAALPASETRFTYGIDFPYAAIGNQWHSWSPTQGSFAEAIAPARTFGLAEQIESLRQAGLIKGGSLENALVCAKTGWVNPPLRFANEPVRHKLLDLVGDLSLLGRFPPAHILAYKASHQLHVALANALWQMSSASQTH